MIYKQIQFQFSKSAGGSSKPFLFVVCSSWSVKLRHHTPLLTKHGVSIEFHVHFKIPYTDSYLYCHLTYLFSSDNLKKKGKKNKKKERQKGREQARFNRVFLSFVLSFFAFSLISCHVALCRANQQPTALTFSSFQYGFISLCHHNSRLFLLPVFIPNMETNAGILRSAVR